jgi:ubiquinone/menaquinone biosynthesis C-methylase UbiE
MFFLRKTKSTEPLPIVMCGVRMGERVLQIGIDDPSLAGVIAAKVGLSGHAAIAVIDDGAAERARVAAADAGVLVDTQVTALDALPFPEDSFDVVVLHAVTGALPPLHGAAGLPILREVHRVLRAGGRTVILEQGQNQRTWFQSRSPQPQTGATATALDTAGFRAARHLADRDGYSFTEGLK